MTNKFILLLIIIILILLFFVYKQKKSNKVKLNKNKVKLKKNRVKFKLNKDKIKLNKDKDKVKFKSILKKPLKPKNVFFTVEKNGNIVGNIVIKLFDEIVPKTINNFRTLCEYKKYIRTPFHRIIKDFMIQGGDFTNHNGTGGESIYGKKFEDENFELNHDKPYLLSMANSGPNTNGSQFFITTSITSHLDGKHVVFGEVIKGFDIIYDLNITDTDNKDMPTDRILISDCGLI